MTQPPSSFAAAEDAGGAVFVHLKTRTKPTGVIAGRFFAGRTVVYFWSQW
jgi:hypothetical protein